MKKIAILFLAAVLFVPFVAAQCGTECWPGDWHNYCSGNSVYRTRTVQCNVYRQVCDPVAPTFCFCQWVPPSYHYEQTEFVQSCARDNGDWGPNYCNGNAVVHSRQYRTGTCSGGSCSWGSWQTEELPVQDCGTTSWGWGPNYCKGNDIYHKEEYHERGCASAACFDNITASRNEGLVQFCPCTCVGEAECNCPPNAVIDEPPDPPPSIKAGDRIKFAGHGEDNDPGDTIKAHKWECDVLSAGGSCPSDFISMTKEVPGKIKFKVNGQYRIRYIVQDNHDAWDQTPAERIITVGPPPANNPPTAEAGGPYEITLPIITVNLNGSGSSDPDLGDTIASYAWAIVNDTVNSANCQASASGMKPQITCSQAGTATATLTVTDNHGATDADDATITVNPLPPVNEPPVADAGPDQVVRPETDVILTSNFDGPDDTDDLPSYDLECCENGPDDPAGCCLAYAWSCSGSSPLPEHGKTATFFAGADRASYTCTLTVTDDIGQSSNDTVKIEVSDDPMPAFFRIASCNLSSATAESGDTVTAVVEVINDGADASSVVVSVQISGSKTVSDSQDIEKDKKKTFSFKFLVPNALEEGNYEVEVGVNDQTPQLCQRLTVFSATPVPTPELSELLLPLIACMVLAIVFFAGRRKTN